MLISLESKIHHEQCGTDSYTGETQENEQGCRDFLGKTVGEIEAHILASSDFKNSNVAHFARTIGLRYSTFKVFKAADAIVMEKPKLKEKLRKDIQNSLISKAYADQNCLLKCQVKDLTQTFVRERSDSNHGTDLPAGTKVFYTSGCHNPSTENLRGFPALWESSKSI